MADTKELRVQRVREQLERQQKDAARKKAAMLQAIESYTLAEQKVALLCSHLERVQDG